jgi:hypothetical protein
MVLALIITLAAIRVTRSDLAGAQATMNSPAGIEADMELAEAD